MGKLVILKLDGDLETDGLRATVEIGKDGSQLKTEEVGNLPPNLELAAHLQHHWQKKYRRLGAPYRITPQNIIYDGSVNEPFKECQESADELFTRLTTWLKSESFRDIDIRLREELNRDEDIRFLIRTENQQLAKIPWHLWDFFEHYPLAEVALSSGKPGKPIPITKKPKIRILAILGHGKGIDIEADRQLLASLPDAETVFLVEPQHEEINDQLWEQPWDIIFFAGHSETEGETGKLYINQTDSLTINELWYALRTAVARGLKLAIFNSCDGLGLARRLDDLQIPQMIVMRELVPDEVAQKFLKYFLTAFSEGQSLYLAVRQARERLQGLEQTFPCASWLPVLYQNPTQGPLTWKDLLAEPEPLPDLPKPLSVWWNWQKVLLTSVAVTSLVMGVRLLGLLQSWELKAFDQSLQLRSAEVRDHRLLLVEITKEEIEHLKDKYPLSDEMLLRLLKKLDEHQPQVIGFNFYRDIPEGKGQANLVQYLKQNHHIVSPCVHSIGNYPGIQPPQGIAGNGVGFIDGVIDSDGTIRRHLLTVTPPDQSPCPAENALSFQLAVQYLKARGHSFKYSTPYTWQIGSVDFDILKAYTGFYQSQKTTRGNQILLNYRSYNSLEDIAKRVTLTQVLSNQVEPNLIEGRIILIGVTDPRLVRDEVNTPYNQKIRSLVLHAQMVSQLISAVEDHRLLLRFWPIWGDLLWVGGWSLVGGIISWRFGSLLHQGVAVGVVLIVLYGSCLIFLMTKGVLVPLVPSALVLLTTGGIVTVKTTLGNQGQK